MEIVGHFGKFETFAHVEIFGNFGKSEILQDNARIKGNFVTYENLRYYFKFHVCLSILSSMLCSNRPGGL